jgi:hypothetical protein
VEFSSAGVGFAEIGDPEIGPAEWVDVESLRSTTEVYAHTILHYPENKSSYG